MLNHALKYLSLGYSVIPLRPGSKEPLISWKEYQSRKASEAEVREWFQKWPNANIGITTGNLSGLAVVDLDGPEGIKQGESLGLVSCLISLTGNGKQLWFAHPKDSLVANEVRTYPGVDIRGEGGYVVAPSSIHPNGKRYRFNRPVLSAEKLPPFPAHFFATPVDGTAGQLVANETRNQSGWIAKALEEMTDGNIDDTLFKVCSRLRNDGYTEQDARVLLEPHAVRVGASDTHLEDKIRNVWGRYEPKQSPRPLTISQSSSTQLVLHSPTSQDSLNEYQRRILGETRDETLKTGYTAFDILTKGLRKGEICVIGARTGVGKSNFIIGPIRTFCQSGKRVLLASTEMSFDQVWSRYIATLPSSEDFKSHQFFVLDDFTPDIERIEEALRQANPDLLVFDHINHVGTDYHFLSKFMSGLKELARRFNIPMIVTAQLNRSADYIDQGQRVEPRLSMVQGSDQIGQMAALVLLLNEKRVVNDMTEIDGIVVKNRHGDRGLIQFGLFKTPFYHIREI